ncbi:hypothetical protein JCGZ_04064 [Jatropha curcas]|uniref:Uncharacterized protein n=1 Tax=Jatropha curcas TaxID=180498 RepID=A0A067KRA2_JATCU|nr:hypothetical protein JCGZ_04064 [Jatropha curcas]
MASAHLVDLHLAISWLARSKPRVESIDPGEGLVRLTPKVEGTALGWLHRAAITSLSWQWKDNGSVPVEFKWLDGLR